MKLLINTRIATRNAKPIMNGRAIFISLFLCGQAFEADGPHSNSTLFPWLEKCCFMALMILLCV